MWPFPGLAEGIWRSEGQELHGAECRLSGGLGFLDVYVYARIVCAYVCDLGDIRCSVVAQTGGVSLGVYRPFTSATSSSRLTKIHVLTVACRRSELKTSMDRTGLKRQYVIPRHLKAASFKQQPQAYVEGAARSKPLMLTIGGGIFKG